MDAEDAEQLGVHQLPAAEPRLERDVWDAGLTAGSAAAGLLKALRIGLPVDERRGSCRKLQGI